jgi:soluble lytic murein transglycosylase
VKIFVRAFAMAVALAGLLSASASAELSDNDRVLYRQAFVEAQTGNWDGVWLLAGQAHDPFPAKLLRWIELTRGGPNARFSDISDFLAANPGWPSQILLRRRAEEALQGATDAALAAWFQRFAPVTPAAKMRQAEMMIAAGHDKDGVDRLHAIWIDANFGAFDEKSFLDRDESYLRPADYVRRLDRLLWDGREADARRMLPRVPLDIRALAEARMALADIAPNAEHLIGLVPASLQTDPGLLYERMRWRRRKEHFDDAIDILEHPPADMVRPAAWAVERQTLARIAMTEGNFAVAYRLASQHGLSDGPVFAELEFLAGWIALRDLKQPEPAYNHFVHLYDQSKMTISKARGAYWAARAATALGRSGDAATWYRKAAEEPTTYYGQLAGAAIGDPALSRIKPEPEPNHDEIAHFESREMVRGARDLIVIGDRDDVRPFLLRLADDATTPGEYVLMARLALALDRPDAALVAAKRAANLGFTLFAESFPLLSPPPAGGSAEEALVLAVTRQESAFDPEAVSPAGARGLMQLMPGTARKMAESLALPYSEARLTEDRGYNMQLGHAYLDAMLNEFGGSYVLAIAAYNAGPARVRQWMAELGDPRAQGTDVIDWVESVPVGETRNYLQRVFENLQVYRLRLGNRDLAFRLAADLKR